MQKPGQKPPLTNCSDQNSAEGPSVIKIYGIRSCDSCRNAQKWLKKQGIEFDYIDIRADGIDEQTLHRWAQAVEWENLLNKRSITWRKIPDIDRVDLNADSAVRLIDNYPTVLKRPVLEYGDQVLLGFDEDQYKSTLMSA
jgi:arsenate reductase